MVQANPVSALGDWVKTRRETLGMTQRDVADSVGTSPAYMSQIEGGRVGLPNADLRRRLAEALGVPHIEIFIAAGELTRDELTASGQQGVLPHPQYGAAPPDLHKLMDQIVWDSDRIRMVRGMFKGMIEIEQ